MLLGPVETYPDTSHPQETTSSEEIAPWKLSSSSAGPANADNTSIGSNKPSKTTSRRRLADPETIQKVEALVQQIVHSLQQEEGNITISLRSQKRPGTSPSANSSRSPAQNYYKLSFPGETPDEAWRFSTTGLVKTVCRRTSSMLTCSPAVVLRILDLIHEALVNDAVVSKRNIYYKDPELFKSQKVVDRYVDILSYTFGIHRAALNVAKGYPDVSTRVFLRLLSISSHPLPSIYAMVDFDPDGISIMSTYKHGSINLSHENANLRCPTIRWLGVRSSDLDFRATTIGLSDDNDDDIKGLLRLSKRDRKKAVKMLSQEICEEHGVEREWRRELQVMLMLNIKVEMEILSQRDGDVETWVEDRLCERMS
ncbi:MAG: hypothetical protein Q9226_007514 [Calogaya cf. arnoldii]